MERQETEYGVLLRDSQNLALFVPDTIQMYTLDGIPEAIPLDQVAQWLAEQFGTRVAEQSKDEAMADPLCLERRQALLPLMVGDLELKRANVSPNVSRLTLNISNACNLW